MGDDEREVAGGMGCKVRVGGSVKRLRCRVGELLIERVSYMRPALSQFKGRRGSQYESITSLNLLLAFKSLQLLNF